MQHDSSLFRNLRTYMEMGRIEKEADKSSNCWEVSESTCRETGQERKKQNHCHRVQAAWLSRRNDSLEVNAGTEVF